MLLLAVISAVAHCPQQVDDGFFEELRGVFLKTLAQIGFHLSVKVPRPRSDGLDRIGILFDLRNRTGGGVIGRSTGRDLALVFAPCLPFREILAGINRKIATRNRQTVGRDLIHRLLRAIKQSSFSHG